jgi:cytolethal distending toxin subunit A
VLVRALRPHVGLPPRPAKKSWRLILAMSVVAAIAVAVGGYVVYEKVAETGTQDGPAETKSVPDGGAGGAPAAESDAARNGNANTQTKDPRKQETTDNRNGPPASSVATPQSSPGQQIANRRLMLVNAKTGKCLTVAGAGYNVEAIQFDCDGDLSRRWTLREMAGSGVYQIRNVQTGKCLTIAGGVSTENNVPALQYECDDDPSRTWRISDVTGSGVYQVENVQTGKCLTIAGGVSTENNVPALQYNCDDDLSRRWRVRLEQ